MLPAETAHATVAPEQTAGAPGSAGRPESAHSAGAAGADQTGRATGSTGYAVGRAGAAVTALAPQDSARAARRSHTLGIGGAFGAVADQRTRHQHVGGRIDHRQNAFLEGLQLGQAVGLDVQVGLVARVEGLQQLRVERRGLTA
jgi:hypothetical protein